MLAGLSIGAAALLLSDLGHDLFVRMEGGWLKALSYLLNGTALALAVLCLVTLRRARQALRG